MLLGPRGRQDGALPEGSAAGSAPGFSLASTDGTTVSLADFRGRDVLLYFNEGVGCDACFYQMAELEADQPVLRERGLTILPIVVNTEPDVRREMARFGVSTPFLIDADRGVSNAYGVLGKGMHADLPGHTFVLVDGTGRIRWARSYPSMFVRTPDLLAAVVPFQ